MTPQKLNAIEAASAGNWEQAVIINKKLLEKNSVDIETLNRLAFAYCVLGKNKQAKKIYQSVLDIDIYNPIANKNLRRLGSITTSTSLHIHQMTNNVFLEEPGKTKIVTLLNTAPAKMIKGLRVGQLVTLSIKRLKIFVLDENKQYVGMLPDDMSKRLIRFLNEGNQYEAFIKAIDTSSVSIFIKELKRVARFKNQASFISTDKKRSVFPASRKKDHVLDELPEDTEEE